VEEAKEVSALSDRIHSTQVMISDWRRIHAKARGYHDHQSELIRKQIAIRQSQRKAMQDQLVDYKAAQEERYKNKMCMLLMRAFHLGGEDDAKVQVNKICHGLKPLALAASASRRQSSPASSIRAKLARVTRMEGAWEGSLSSHLGRIVHSLAAVERRLESRLGGSARGPAQELQARLRELEGLLDDVREECRRDKASWATERTELSRVESDLGDEVVAMHAQKQSVSAEAANKTQQLFCPVVTANYGVSEENIMRHVLSECQ